MSHLECCGRKVYFVGEGGKEYLLFQDGPVSVLGRVEPGGSYLDRVTIHTGKHTVKVEHGGVLVDGKEPLDSHREPGGWVWVEDHGVAVGVEGWHFGVILDDGTGYVHRVQSLENIKHVSLFVVALPPPNCRGALVDVGGDSRIFEV